MQAVGIAVVMMVLFPCPRHFCIIARNVWPTTGKQTAAVFLSVARAVLRTFPVVVETVGDTIPVCIPQPLKLVEKRKSFATVGKRLNSTQRQSKGQNG